MNQSPKDLKASNLPVQTQRVQESRQSFHDDQYADGQHSESPEYQVDYGRSSSAFHLERVAHDHAPQNFGQL